ncbi:aminoacyl-tRNA hydrolase [Candidatus Daviesbacteria bacterium RIFOXYD1_FULL_41_10]|uniref:Peptidyl-tRNA hydrolase n=1 Tax=Candidatus Daviesbacteria bacterium RIFOXYD1_FULL_41_10 TaxID=1797801 RepID=A0A1F5N0X0_9BACT|nr:MAG: aminoacyl-tRNA hydrolase [Candidatus Daviesbacteria bacterium RIFOXYD1_FULL_41_10]
MKLIVGLGNPGEKYQNTRHNLGFGVIDKLAASVERSASSWKLKKELKSEIIQANYTLDASIYTLILAKPQIYMNNSGMAVKLLADYYKVKPADIIVIHDDLDLPLGKIKVRMGGSAAGHHGVESVISALGDDKFIRVRVGIGPQTGVTFHKLERHKVEHGTVEKFVLETFTSQEKTKVKKMILQSAKAVKLILEKGLEVAQNQYN